MKSINLKEAIALAEQTKLTLCDASYLWLAHALRAELVMLDERLARADAELSSRK